MRGQRSSQPTTAEPDPGRCPGLRSEAPSGRSGAPPGAAQPSLVREPQGSSSRVAAKAAILASEAQGETLRGARQAVWGPRARVLISLAALGGLAALELGLDLRDLAPSSGGLTVARELLSRAFSPAWAREGTAAVDAEPLLVTALEAAWVTVQLAAAASGLALLLGAPLGLLASSVVWRLDGPPSASRGPRGARLGRRVGFGLARALIAGLRSVHEILWAVLLLAALGLSQLSAVVAIAIPYAGTLAKVFSEMLDETPRDAGLALRDLGATSLQALMYGWLPRAFPDLAAYAFYRFECALRAAAVLGFFGFPTLGYHLLVSFENLHYGELWTFLYTLIALVMVVDAWSGWLRRRLLA